MPLIAPERSWNGLWIKWRDVVHTPGFPEPVTISDGLSFMSFRSLVHAAKAQNDMAAGSRESSTEPEAPPSPVEAVNRGGGGGGAVAEWGGS